MFLCPGFHPVACQGPGLVLTKRRALSSSVSPSATQGEVQLLISSTDGETGAQKISNLTKITQLVDITARTWPQIVDLKAV